MEQMLIVCAFVNRTQLCDIEKDRWKKMWKRDC